VVKETIEAAFFSDDKTIATEKLLETIAITKPISVTLKKEIDPL